MLNEIKQFINKHFIFTTFIIFAVVIFSLYGKSLFFSWTYYDDDVLILDKQQYLSFSNIDKIFFNTVFSQETDKFCRPILNLTFLIEKYIYGTKPFGYHFTNVLLHLFVVWLVFVFLSKYYSYGKTFLLCLLFACHPSIVQAVSWVPGRNDSLLTLFIILSFCFIMGYIDTNKLYYLFTHLFCFCLALFTKETAIVAPIFYFSVLYFKNIKIKKFLLLIFMWLVIVLVYVFYRNYVLSYQEESLTFYELIKNFFISFPAITKYIANIFFPIKLSIFSMLLELNWLLCISSILVFTLFFLRFKEYNLKFIIFGFCWFLFFIFPTFLMPNNQFYDHRIYLALIGILIVLLELINKTNNIFNKKNIIIFSLIFIVFCAITFFYELKFKDKENFWVNAYLDSPQSDVACAMVAGLFLEKKMYKEAKEKYLEAIKLKADSKHYVNLSILYMKMKQIDSAENCLIKALFLDKNNPNIYYNLALIYKIKKDEQKYKEMKKCYIMIYNNTNKFNKIDDVVI